MADPRLITAVDDLIRAAERPGHVPLIGVSGAQGSGKTTLVQAAAQALGAAHMSLDDSYFTRAERGRMARAIHPLFAVRGPPGTHDLGLLAQTIAALRAAGPKDPVALPSFDKLADDRRPETQWPIFTGRPRAILIDGWVIGARAQTPEDLKAPVNDLERNEDREGAWRRAVNGFLQGGQAVLTDGFDAVLFLRAPSFDCVLGWRCEQEAALRGVAPEDLDDEVRTGLRRFTAHFERLTRHMLAGGGRADRTLRLDARRRIISMPEDDPSGS